MLRLALIPTAFASVALAANKCLPGQPCFPSASTLNAFNQSISGALLMPPPYGSVCYTSHWNATACAQLVQNKQSPEFRETIPAAVMYTENEFDENGRGCRVPNTVPTAPLKGDCVLGALVTYVVEATTSDQVVQSVQFAAKYNLRLVIKNSGHDYFGRSTDSGGFAIKMLGLKDIEYKPGYTLSQCSETHNIVAAGAGNNVGDLYKFADESNVLLNGGYNPSVGACGGYWMSGGTGSPFGPELGYGVDRVVQFDIVLADGTMTTANKCLNPDLYWAVKGGGGVFGVVTTIYILAAPAPKKINLIAGTLTANSTSSYNDMMAALVEQSPTIRNDLTSCLLETSNHTLQILCLKTFNNQSQVVSAKKSAKVFNPVSSVSGVTPAITSKQYDTWYQAYKELVSPIVQMGAPVGLSLLDNSRILNETTLTTTAGRNAVKDFLVGVPAAQPVILEWNGGYAASKFTNDDASINPLWRQAVGYIVAPVFSPSNGPATAVQNSTSDAVAAAMDKYIGYASYTNEDNVRLTNWQDRFWGDNYARLLKIKKEYDPKGLLTCKLCVGSEIYGD